MSFAESPRALPPFKFLNSAHQREHPDGKNTASQHFKHQSRKRQSTDSAAIAHAPGACLHPQIALVNKPTFPAPTNYFPTAAPTGVEGIQKLKLFK